MERKQSQYSKNEEKLTQPRKNKISFSEWLVILLFESNPIKSNLKGILLGAAILWAILQQDYVPLIAWVIVSLILNIIGILYWRREMKNAKTKMDKIDKELQALNQQIKEKQAHFEKLRENLFKNSSN